MRNRPAITNIALLLMGSAAVLAHYEDTGTEYVDGWQRSDHAIIKGKGRAIVLRGDDDLCSFAVLDKVPDYEMDCSWKIEDNLRIVVYSRLRAYERGGDQTVLELPEKRTVIYTAPSGKAIADARMMLPDEYRTNRKRAGSSSDTKRDLLYMEGGPHFGQERIKIDWTDSSDQQYCWIWGDRWGSDINALRYELHARYQVQLVDMGSMNWDARPQYKPGKDWSDYLPPRP